VEEKIIEINKIYNKIHNIVLDAGLSYQTLISSDICIPILTNTHEGNCLLSIQKALWKSVILNLRKIHERASVDKATVENIINVLDDEVVNALNQKHNENRKSKPVYCAKTNEEITDYYSKIDYRPIDFHQVFSQLKDYYRSNKIEKYRTNLKDYRDENFHSILNATKTYSHEELKEFMHESIIILNKISYLIKDETKDYSFWSEDSARFSKVFWGSLVAGYDKETASPRRQ